MAQRTRSTDAEIAYLNSQMLGRIATVDANGRPRVVPAGFSHNPETGTIDLGGVGLTQIRRYRHVQ